MIFLNYLICLIELNWDLKAIKLFSEDAGVIVKIFWFYDFLGEFVNLAGWGLKYDPKTNQYAVESTLKLANLEVNSREVCEEIFGRENLEDNDINVRLLQRQIPRGFTSDITCVGNDFDVEQGK